MHQCILANILEQSFFKVLPYQYFNHSDAPDWVQP